MEKLEFAFDFKDLGPSGEFEGWASTWDLDLGNDKLLPGAFKTTLRKNNGKVPVLFNHERSKIIGIGTEAQEDQRGLYVKAKLAMNTQLGRETHELMQLGALKGLSIGYSTGPKDWVMDGSVRLIKAVALYEYSATPFPMNLDAQIARVKTLAEMTEREFEDSIRDVFGFSQKEAKTLVAKGFRALKEQRDVGSDELGVEAEQFLSRMQDRIQSAEVATWLNRLSPTA